MKWIIGTICVLAIYSLATGYTGGAKKAASNYNKLLTQNKR